MMTVQMGKIYSSVDQEYKISSKNKKEIDKKYNSSKTMCLAAQGPLSFGLSYKRKHKWKTRQYKDCVVLCKPNKKNIFEEAIYYIMKQKNERINKTSN